MLFRSRQSITPIPCWAGPPVAAATGWMVGREPKAPAPLSTRRLPRQALACARALPRAPRLSAPTYACSFRFEPWDDRIRLNPPCQPTQTNKMQSGAFSFRPYPDAPQIAHGAFFYGLWCYPTGKRLRPSLPILVRFDGLNIFFSNHADFSCNMIFS